MADFPSAESESQSGGDPSASEASKPASSRAGGDGRSPRTDPVVPESEEATPEEKAAPEKSPDAPRQHLAAALRLGLPSDADGGSEREARSDQRLLYTRLTAFETVLVAGGVVLFLLLLYGMWSFLSPPLLALAGGLLMWPLREHRTVRALMVSGGVLLLLWLLADLSTVLLPFGLMYVLAYLFDPFVAYLHRRFGISRRLSSLLITALVTGLLVLVVVLLVPRLVGQLEVLVQRFLTGIGDLRTWVAGTPLLDDFENSGLLSREELVDQINALLQGQSGRIASGLPAIIQGLADSLDSVLGAITVIAIMPVVLFYTLKDYRVITRRLMELFPTFGGRRDYLINASQIVGSYLRGQLLVCAIAGFNVSLFLSPLIFDVPLWLLLGLVAGIANLVPNLGAILSMVVAVAITLIFGDPWLMDTVAVVAVLMGQGFLEQSVLTPNIMSHQVGLHPVLVMLSLFVFGYFMGAFGALIAVPATALIMTIYKSYRKDLTLDLSAYGTPASDPQAQREA
jgi:predicted PurR-regulated permease PerM